LKWLEYDVKVFNVGQLRRSRAKQKREQSGVKEDHTASYFSHNNAEATRLRDQLASDSLEMLIQWLRDGGNVGIHDATNSTRERRYVPFVSHHASPTVLSTGLSSSDGWQSRKG
jgi:6-phosphofructo-2-kinase/fructose-2,6-biphosphatase 2